MAKQKNWDQIRKQKPTETVQYRDVYEDQQLERSEIQEKASMKGRMILLICLTILVFVVMYFISSSLHMLTDSLGLTGGEPEIEAPLNPDDVLTYDKASNVYLTDDGTKVSVDEYKEYVRIYQEKLKVYEESQTQSVTADGDAPPVNPEDVYRFELNHYEDVDGNKLSKDDYEKAVKQYEKDIAKYEATHGPVNDEDDSGGLLHNDHSFSYYLRPDAFNILLSLVVSVIFCGFLHVVLTRNLKAANLMADTSDINQYHNDQHVALPEEVQRKYDWFPDVGAHSNVQVSSMISHMALMNKGLKKIEFAKRATKDIVDDDGDVMYYKGEIIEDANGKPITSMVPMIDEKFMDDLYSASGAPNEKSIRKYYDATKIPYNPGNENRDKLSGFDTVADLINKDWQFPLYEPQRPAGAYVVDTAPVNTMVLAITRAGKGQTVIEPTIDMWTRELQPNNMVINDPKGELLVKNYVKATVRGFQIVQFNLINAMKTDIYNPLALAAESAREGDITKCSMYIENIADVFFPVDGAEDPVWPNAANNALIDGAFSVNFITQRCA